MTKAKIIERLAAIEADNGGMLSCYLDRIPHLEGLRGYAALQDATRYFRIDAAEVPAVLAALKAAELRHRGARRSLV